jgi:N-methylhydantoinase A
MYGYSLEGENAPIELINVRLRAVGLTSKPAYAEEPYVGKDPVLALKGERRIFVLEDRASRSVSVYDGHKTRHGNHVVGPAVIEQENTTLLLGSSFDCVCDKYGSFVVYERGRESRLAPALQEMAT